jgi:hypothetical protein
MRIREILQCRNGHECRCALQRWAIILHMFHAELRSVMRLRDGKTIRLTEPVLFCMWKKLNCTDATSLEYEHAVFRKPLCSAIEKSGVDWYEMSKQFFFILS